MNKEKNKFQKICKSISKYLMTFDKNKNIDYYQEYYIRIF